jgi:hypothetical protein
VSHGLAALPVAAGRSLPTVTPLRMRRNRRPVRLGGGDVGAADFIRPSRGAWTRRTSCRRVAASRPVISFRWGR